MPTDRAWEIDRSRLALADIIGEGAFGEVWRGALHTRGYTGGSGGGRGGGGSLNLDAESAQLLDGDDNAVGAVIDEQIRLTLFYFSCQLPLNGSSQALKRRN